MFLGEFEHSLDDKGRVAIPSRFRETLGEVVYITRGFERCLMGFTADRWQKLSEDFEKLPLSQSDARQLRRFLFSNAADSPIDKQGRILIPPKLREYAGLSDQAIFAGNNTYFEVWSSEGWVKVQEGFETSGGQLAEQLAGLGL
jgi:MraZ protein